MSTVPILSLVTFLPLVGALFILTIRGDEAVVAQNARGVALWTSLFTFAISLFITTVAFPFNKECLLLYSSSYVI